MVPRALTISALPQQKPTRHPAMLYVFDIVVNSTPTSFAPCDARNDGALYPSKFTSPYAKSLMIMTPRRRHISIARSQNRWSSIVIDVGLCGKFRINNFGVG